eukprot:maker-scaffold425_size175135-snap-gene-0.54 protein:Tk05833 transcript:maker-scaffold425_size175135-snap-gene-0.54-mRNA-1 annotation:"myotubularin-related protein 2"
MSSRPPGMEGSRRMAAASGAGTASSTPPRRPPRQHVGPANREGSPPSPNTSAGSSSSEGPDLPAGVSGGERGAAESRHPIVHDSVPLLGGEAIVTQYPDMIYLCPYSVPNSMRGVLTITNYRLYYQAAHREGPLNLDVPLGYVSRLEKFGRQRTSAELSYGLEIVCKDIRSLRFALNKIDSNRRDIFETLHLYCFPRSHNAPFFAFKFTDTFLGDGWNVYDPVGELKRQGLPNESWKISRINDRYEICDTYPRILGTPASVPDDKVMEVAKFRARGRFPVLSWMHPESLATICRCAQPLVGIASNKSPEDQEYVQAIMDANAQSHKIFIMDARPKINSMVNRVNGGGSENEDFYQNAEVFFLDIQNIHVMRESLRQVRVICFPVIDDKSWLSNVDKTNWLRRLHSILAGAVNVADKVENAKTSVIVHCSDGWDRTAQITSLAMLFLDPYFRSLRGFQVLIEKEWLSFGHKFAARIGHGEDNPKDNDRSPVFLQFIDCVWQVMNQFPNSFEFNEEFLTTLLEHLYSCLFGTFLYNSDKERRQQALSKNSKSLWSHINAHKKLFLNPNYMPPAANEVRAIFPETSDRYLKLWTCYYCRWNPRMRPQDSVRQRKSQLGGMHTELRLKMDGFKKELESKRKARDESIPTAVGPQSAALVTKFESFNI